MWSVSVGCFQKDRRLMLNTGCTCPWAGAPAWMKKEEVIQVSAFITVTDWTKCDQPPLLLLPEWPALLTVSPAPQDPCFLSVTLYHSHRSCHPHLVPFVTQWMANTLYSVVSSCVL